jgi:hypothetical protein
MCRAARAGGLEFLRTLPGLVVCGGRTSTGEIVSDVWRLDLATLRWEPMPALVTARRLPACCAMRGTLVVLGGRTSEFLQGPNGLASSVEVLSSEAGASFVDLPPLSCGGIDSAATIAVDESDSAAGEVLLIGGGDATGPLSTVTLVDLATGECAPPQNNLLHNRRVYLAAGRLPDGRVVCAGGFGGAMSVEIWGPPEEVGAADAAWTWSNLPAMSVQRIGCCGCVMSNGRFAILGGRGNNHDSPLSCEALTIDDGDAHWEPLPPMHVT